MTTQANQSSHTITADPPNWTTPEKFYINAQVGEEYERPAPIGLALITSKRWTLHADGKVTITLTYGPAT